MNAGAYRHRVVIEHKTQYEDEDQFKTEEWEDYYSNYAYINNISGNERWIAAQVQMDRTVRFTFRHHKALDSLNTTDYRINWNNHIYTITNVDNVQYLNEVVKVDTLEVE